MRRLALALSLALVALPAWAGQTVTLKAQIFDPDGVITLGEIFDNAKAAGQVVVASREGQTTVLDAALVQSIAHRNGLDWANSEGLRRIAAAASSTMRRHGSGYGPDLGQGRLRPKRLSVRCRPTDWHGGQATPADGGSRRKA